MSNNVQSNDKVATQILLAKLLRTDKKNIEQTPHSNKHFTY